MSDTRPTWKGHPDYRVVVHRTATHRYEWYPNLPPQGQVHEIPRRARNSSDVTYLHVRWESQQVLAKAVAMEMATKRG